MLHIAHHVRASAIAGVGLFSSEFVPAGSVIYTCDPRTTRIIADAEIASYPLQVRDSILRYCYRGRGIHRLSGAYYFCIDDARFFNHSDTPNCLWQEDRECYIAVGDIAAGTELTCDYFDFNEPEDIPYLRAPRVAA
ncbi:SET domain-containing protein [Sinimarinibacterium sp. CAU 1509]|uniref:SET domain-containing protein n=1 Tax=Sinimarinibacterium sp. CAU 1509 TaxID=2562283 RepID=UPI00146D6CB9|nr:SET domain-containing protein [Sinimarinibacterium sp. CAU 1509]